MDQFELTFPFKARYYKLGNITPSTTQCWFVLHGQGQLAQYFIKKFKQLESLGICVIAPEGMSRYYLNGYNGRVGANWMTKENRVMDIENYIQFLNTLYRSENIPTHIQTTVLGFSQGAATASRWVMDGNVNFKKLILWGGIFPSDMDFEKGSDVFKNKEVCSVNGTNDPFIKDEHFSTMRNISERLNIDVHEIVFEGAHEIDEATLSKLI